LLERLSHKDVLVHIFDEYASDFLLAADEAVVVTFRTP